jgi:hypothetical protein
MTNPCGVYLIKQNVVRFDPIYVNDHQSRFPVVILGNHTNRNILQVLNQSISTFLQCVQLFAGFIIPT